MFQDAVSRRTPADVRGLVELCSTMRGFECHISLHISVQEPAPRGLRSKCLQFQRCYGATVQPVNGWQFGCLKRGQSVAGVVIMAGAEKCAEVDMTLMM